VRRFLPFLFLVPLTLAALSGRAASQATIDNEIAERVAKVEGAADTDARIESAAHLAEYIASRGPVEIANIDPPIIDDMAELLSDGEDWVRFYVAASLGFLGPSARRAIPALEHALERDAIPADPSTGSTGILRGLSSAQAICAAFEKIDLNRIPANCRSYR